MKQRLATAPRSGGVEIEKSRAPIGRNLSPWPTKEAAEAAGKFLFFTGQRCERGHIANRFTMTGGCTLCPITEPGPRRRALKPFAPKPIDHDLLERTRVRELRRCAIVRCRNLLARAVRDGGFHKVPDAERMIGCTWEQFRAHIERQFTKGMTWENRGLWNIDHIVPISSATTPEEAEQLSHFTNLRPLWAGANCEKGAQRTHLL